MRTSLDSAPGYSVAVTGKRRAAVTAEFVASKLLQAIQPEIEKARQGSPEEEKVS